MVFPLISDAADLRPNSMCHLCRITITPTSEAAALSARLARVMGEAKKEEARDQFEAFQLLPLDEMGQTKIDFGSAHLSAQKSCSMLMDESWEPVQEIEIQPEIHTEMAAMDIRLQTIEGAMQEIIAHLRGS